jgi:leucyl aminopeptidase
MQKNYADGHKFKGEGGQAVLLPGDNGKVSAVLFGAGKDEDSYANGPIQTGSLSAKLPGGFYEIAAKPETWSDELIAVFWGKGAYKFTRYLQDDNNAPTLVINDDTAVEEIEALVQALHMGRDLINTPAGDMGPVALQDSAQQIADKYGAKLEAIIGDELLDKNYPMIHAVGRAAHEPPRLVHLSWGSQDAPKLSLVGKGITFDCGGLDIKSAAGMRIMKKDMGGAAHALSLAEMIMANKLPLRLNVFLAVAENAISANSFRPGDILSSREGLSVEIDNTDAEGRLVLGDALTRAAEGKPDLIIDFATLTGAARVALGPTLPPFFSNREEPVTALLEQGREQSDPFWRMPLWQPYMSMLNSPIADMKNAGGSFAGAVTAALFLQKFVGDTPWMHFDVYGWNPNGSPSKPKGGEIFATRAIYHWLKNGGLKD